MIPQIYDTARRVIRTVIQVALGFVAFAPVYPLIVDAIGLPKNSNIGLWLTASVFIVTGVAAVITRIMAIPAVNGVLAKVKLDGHSGEITARDSYTQMIAVQQPAQSSGDVAGDGAH